MFKLDNDFLQSLGLGGLPVEEKNRLLQMIYERLEMNVGMRLAEKMTDQQLDEFESFIDKNDEAGALKWLETNFPNYKDVVAEELEKLKGEVQAAAPQILASSPGGNGATGPTQPMPAIMQEPQMPGVDQPQFAAQPMQAQQYSQSQPMQSMQPQPSPYSQPMQPQPMQSYQQQPQMSPSYVQSPAPTPMYPPAPQQQVSPFGPQQMPQQAPQYVQQQPPIQPYAQQPAQYQAQQQQPPYEPQQPAPAQQPQSVQPQPTQQQFTPPPQGWQGQ